ncbi:hypothetical protein BDW69DRAFT_203445 [Aspergillus filifer]
MIGRKKQPPRRYACARCSQLKVKCVLSRTGGACQRCTRLGHSSCVFPADVRGCPRTITPSMGSSTPISSSNNEDECGSDFVFHPAITYQIADGLLSKYLVYKQPQFPFVIVPPGTTVSALRRESPFLLLCMLTASLEENPSLQDELEVHVRKEIATRIVVGIERDMDILQGLLVHAAWYHYHWRTYHTHGYMLLQMTVMVVIDLGLDRQEGFRMRAIPLEGSSNWTKEAVSQSSAEQRALLGCYYLCSSLSLFRRQLHMRHTPWIDRCAELLGEQPTYATDARLKALVDVQLLMHQSRLLFDDHRRCSNQPASPIGEQVAELIAKQAQMRELLASAGAESNWSLRIELAGAPALILGQALGGQRHVSELEKANELTGLTASAHHAIDTFLAVPSSLIIHLPASAHATTWFCLLALSKLSLLFQTRGDQAIKVGLDNKSIHDKGAAIMQRFQDLDHGGEGFWTSSRKIIASMLAWLKKPGADVRPKSASTDIHTQNDWSPVGSPGQATAMAVEFPLTDALDAELWQQMLDNFTWFRSATIHDGLSLDHCQL